MRRAFITTIIAAPLLTIVLSGCCKTEGDHVQMFNREDDNCHVNWAEQRGHYPTWNCHDDGFAFWHPRERWDTVETHAFLRASLARDHRWHDSDRRIRIEREQVDRDYYRQLLYPSVEHLHYILDSWDAEMHAVAPPAETNPPNTESGGA